jgi:hypothetical protein
VAEKRIVKQGFIAASLDPLLSLFYRFCDLFKHSLDRANWGIAGAYPVGCGEIPGWPWRRTVDGHSASETGAQSGAPWCLDRPGRAA